MGSLDQFPRTGWMREGAWPWQNVVADWPGHAIEGVGSETRINERSRPSGGMVSAPSAAVPRADLEG